MENEKQQLILAENLVAGKIYYIRDRRVILDRDLAELYGTEGEAYSKPEYKVGLRWEPNSYIVPAISYGACFDGSPGAGFEIGVIIFTPQFLKKDFIKNNSIQF